MSVQTKERITLSSGESGYATGILLDSGACGEPVKTTTEVKIVCDYEECVEGIYTGMNEENLPVRVRGRRTIEFNDGDPENLPAEVWQILTLVQWDNTKRVFCCGRCLDKWKSEKFVALKPPGNIIPFPVKEG